MSRVPFTHLFYYPDATIRLLQVHRYSLILIITVPISEQKYRSQAPPQINRTVILFITSLKIV